MLPTFKTRLGLAQNARKFTRVPNVAVVFKLGADTNGIKAPRIPPDVPVERVAQEAPVQVHNILLVQLAERRLRTREPGCRCKHLSRKKLERRRFEFSPSPTRWSQTDHVIRRWCTRSKGAPVLPKTRAWDTMNDVVGGLFALVTLWVIVRIIGGGTWRLLT